MENRNAHLLRELRGELRQAADPKRAAVVQKYFKTGKGEYAEGDIFLGVAAPQARAAVKKYWREISIADVQTLLQSEIYEERTAALLILVKKFEKSDPAGQAAIFDLYLGNTKHINNWDLVDLSAPKIVGAYLEGRDKSILFELAKSKNLWERRIAMLATFWFIGKGEAECALKIAAMIINDKEDLIHKAVGWGLREIGKQCGKEIEEEFLNKHYKTMPRMALRYAIERFSSERREHYMKRVSLKHSSMVK